MRVELIKRLKRKGRPALEVGCLVSFTNDFANELIKKKIAIEYKPGIKPVENNNKPGVPEKND